MNLDKLQFIIEHFYVYAMLFYLVLCGFRTIFDISNIQYYITKYTFGLIGVIGFWSFIGHIFYSRQTAKLIGWKSNGFQWEVGMTDLAIGILGTLSYFDIYSSGFRLATIILSTIFLWGAAINHILEYIYKHNKSPLNSNIVLFYDILIPFILLFNISMI